MFGHAEWELTTVLHGDDYVSSGPLEGLLKLQKAVEARFELGKTVHFGVHNGAVSEGKVLNRIIRRSSAGWELEADMRHGEFLSGS